MEYKAPKIKINGQAYELITPAELNNRLGVVISTPVLSYQLKNNKIDYCSYYGIRLIVWNQKAQDFKITTRGRKKV